MSSTANMTLDYADFRAGRRWSNPISRASLRARIPDSG
jgi:hypothetical protein